MAQRATFSLDDDVIDFLNREGGDNKSTYVNELLKREKQRLLQEALLKANQEEAEDIEYQKEVSDWDTTLSDGLNP